MLKKILYILLICPVVTFANALHDYVSVKNAVEIGQPISFIMDFSRRTSMNEVTLVDVVQLSREQAQHPIRCELKYTGCDNFVGRSLSGYTKAAAQKCLLTPQPAAALINVQQYLNTQNIGLYVFDAYRPKKAVLDIIEWSKQAPADDHELAMKAKHFPALEKKDLFRLGYVAEDSTHCYGNTIDLTLIDLNTGEHLDMGTIFDFMGEASHPDSDHVDEQAKINRRRLTQAMQKFGFLPYDKEWWHFSYKVREVQQPLNIAMR